MVMWLDYHIVDPWFKSWTRWLKLMLGVYACVPKIPRGQWRRRDCGVAIPLVGDFSFSVSLSVFLESARAL